MAYIFVNLKRFDVPRELGGLCPEKNPQEWIKKIAHDSMREGLGKIDGLELIYLLPEGLYSTAYQVLSQQNSRIELGVQGVHWVDVRESENFGALTTCVPAASLKANNVEWAIIGHSEERRKLYQVIQSYEPGLDNDFNKQVRAATAVDRLIGKSVNNALARGINILLCIGESAEERGEGTQEDKNTRVCKVLSRQLEMAFEYISSEDLNGVKIVVGYEPIWAIGPGKTPPGKEYISFVSEYVKDYTKKELGFAPAVVYGGGLKVANAAMVASIDSIDGGLVALTKFTGDICFEVEGLHSIMQKYSQGLG